MIYPEAIEIDGTEYAINTGYEFALSCFRCINDPEISDAERALGVVGLLYVDQPPDERLSEALRLALKYLRCGKEPDQPNTDDPDMDFEADEQFIRASFLSDYHIDLDEPETGSMHWWKFSTLLQGLTDKSVLNRVRDLRNYDTSTIKDPADRQRIIRAQQEVALPARIAAAERSIADDFFAMLKD